MGAFLDARRRLIGRYGQTITVVRGATTGTCKAFIGQKAPVSGDTTDSLMLQGDARLELLAEDLPSFGEPAAPDEVRTASGASMTILQCLPVMEGEAVIGYSASLRGAT